MNASGPPSKANKAIDIQVSPPVTLSGILPDLIVHTPKRKNAPLWKHALRVVATALISSGFHMMLVYRVGAFCDKLHLRPLSLMCERFIYHWYHCLIPTSVQIGPGLWVPHPLGIILNSHVKIGRYVALLQNVEIIDIWPGDIGKSGLVGDRTALYSGAILLRGAVVCEESIVAARSLVSKPVPPQTVAMGMPAEFRPIRSRELGSARNRDPQTRGG